MNQMLKANQIVLLSTLKLFILLFCQNYDFVRIITFTTLEVCPKSFLQILWNWKLDVILFKYPDLSKLSNIQFNKSMHFACCVSSKPNNTSLSHWQTPIYSLEMTVWWICFPPPLPRLPVVNERDAEYSNSRWNEHFLFSIFLTFSTDSLLFASIEKLPQLPSLCHKCILW